jgi:hypothetical protein
MDIEARLATKLTKLFPEKEDRNEAIALLESYGQESYEQEPTRVRLAILKLAGQSPNIAELKKYTNAAKADFRDVLSWAEYPRQSKSWSAKGAQKQRLIEADLNDYQTWLNT